MQASLSALKHAHAHARKQAGRNPVSSLWQCRKHAHARKQACPHHHCAPQLQGSSSENEIRLLQENQELKRQISG